MQLTVTAFKNQDKNHFHVYSSAFSNPIIIKDASITSLLPYLALPAQAEGYKVCCCWKMKLKKLHVAVFV